MKKKLIILIFFLFLILLYVCNINNIPENIILLENEELNIKRLYGVSLNEEEYIETSASVDEKKIRNINVNLYGLKVKEIKVTEIPRIKVVPVGKLIGLKIYTAGILVVGKEESDKSNIIEGDIIKSINGERIETIDDIKEIVKESRGNDLKVEYLRNKETVLVDVITPVKNENNEYQLGLWVKEGATGVGTISFYNPDTYEFAALGHGVYDKDIGTLLNIEQGELVSSKIVSITKGEYGVPGEIRGTLEKESLGVITSNTEFGIYGVLENTKGLEYKESIEIGSREEIKVGEAYILCSLDGLEPKKYSINIENIIKENNENNRSMKIKITDRELLEKTGGIICGMSGCPIIQNNKLIGVVTNVLVNNSEIGYAVFADLMINEMTK